ncbi:MAG: hypothetical protein WBR21_08240 [Rouxiella badensis]|uniref:phage baseplate plug family protein n=1 Tax=Rouxiella badensis TaxID=1646377 RepID=UPI001D13BC71|nr:hypothetical protein [Rouxiella badensis]MCC3717982.1 hypothetical protein [Rouxiella badensis]MCC3730003.1 hypothetical protein [Rouxiella badensis]
MNITELPLTADNQSFSVTINSTVYEITIIWRGTGWFLDLMDNAGTLIIGGIALVTLVDLLAQYQYLGLDFSLYVVCDVQGQEYPTQTDLGTTSHLYIVTE